MSADNGFEIAPLNPGWIKRVVPDSYADDGLKKIIMFYVINTPCIQLSSSAIPLKKYGWPCNVWKKGELRKQLFDVAGLELGDTVVIAKKASDMKKVCKKANLDKNFHKSRQIERIAIYLGNYNTFLSICYHIRNSLAHGRLAMYENEEKEIIFALEDGIRKNGKFSVRSRMILKKSTLLKWIDILQRNDIQEEI